MPPLTPKVAFAFGSDPVVRVWGRVVGDVVELSAGPKPNLVELAVPAHEFSKLAGDYDRTGTLEIYLSDPDTPDVALEFWSIDSVRDSAFGTLVGAGSAAVVERTLALSDRRWEFTLDRGGHAFWGLINQTTADGEGVSNPPGVLPFGTVGGAAATFRDCARSLISLFQYASGGEPFSADTIEPRLIAVTVPVPTDLRWDGVHAWTELGRIFDQAEFALWVRRDGTYDLSAIGLGDLPAPDGATLLPSEPLVTRQARPPIVVISSAPRRLLVEETVTGIADNGWQYVGLETDGTLLPLADLSYVIDSELTPQELIRENFGSLAGADLELAAGTMFQTVRLSGTARAGRLPISTRLATAADDAAGPRATTLRVEAKCARWNNAAMGYLNQDDWVPVDDWDLVDPIEGIIRFREPLGRVAENGINRLAPSFVPLAADQLRVTWAHPYTRAGAGERAPADDFFTRAYTLDAGGAVIETSVATALDPETVGVRVISMPQLGGYVAGAALLNEARLEEIASQVAGRILSQPQATEVRRWVGFHAVDPSGVVPAVRWDLRGCLTEIECRTYFIARSRYLERGALIDVARSARAGAAGAAAAPAESSAGGRDWAALAARSPGSSMRLPPPGDSLRWGKATADWASGTPNVVTVNPCDADGDNVDAGTTITLRLLTPTGAAPAFCGVATDDVIAWLPTGGDEGIAVNAPVWPFDANWPLRIDETTGELHFEADLAGAGGEAACFELVTISGKPTLFLKALNGVPATFQDANAGDWWRIDAYGRVAPYTPP